MKAVVAASSALWLLKAEDCQVVETQVVVAMEMG